MALPDGSLTFILLNTFVHIIRSILNAMYVDVEYILVRKHGISLFVARY